MKLVDIYIFNVFQSIAAIIVPGTQAIPSLAHENLLKLDFCPCDIIIISL